MKLLPNTIEGLKFGLQNFDAVETDIRLTKDDKLVIYHDPVLPDGRLIRQMTRDQITRAGIPSFSEFLENDEISELMRGGKKVWLEGKPDCNNKRSVHDSIASIMHDEVVRNIDTHDIPSSAFHMLSFQKALLRPFVDEEQFQTYFILPYINECNPNFIMLKALPRILFKSLTKHIEDVQQEGHRGVLFARQYLFGFGAKFHPSYSRLCDLMDETGVELGTNLGIVELEDDFRRLHRFSDKTQVHPRYAREGEGMIIAHRGTGTKGIEI